MTGKAPAHRCRSVDCASALAVSLIVVLVRRFRNELRAAVRPQRAEDLIRFDLTKHVLDGPGWRRTSHGFYVPSGVVPSTPTQRIIEAAAVAPAEGVLGGWAAAYALGAELLDGCDDHTMRPVPVTVILPNGQHRRSTAGIRFRQQQRCCDDAQVLPTPARLSSTGNHACGCSACSTLAGRHRRSTSRSSARVVSSWAYRTCWTSTPG